MKIYDISQELLSSVVYPGDPVPVAERVRALDKGDVCNLTALHLCAHNGTHVDAPRHFLPDGVGVDGISLEKTVGPCYVCRFDGVLGASDARSILLRAKAAAEGAEKRILLSGDATVSVAAARVFAEAGIFLVGNESQTVGPKEGPMEVHLILLGVGTVLLEGVRLSAVPDGAYFLRAAPLCIADADGAPVRALLLDLQTS